MTMAKMITSSDWKMTRFVSSFHLGLEPLFYPWLPTSSKTGQGHNHYDYNDGDYDYIDDDYVDNDENWKEILG